MLGPALADLPRPENTRNLNGSLNWIAMSLASALPVPGALSKVAHRHLGLTVSVAGSVAERRAWLRHSAACRQCQRSARLTLHAQRLVSRTIPAAQARRQPPASDSLRSEFSGGGRRRGGLQQHQARACTHLDEGVLEPGSNGAVDQDALRRANSHLEPR